MWTIHTLVNEVKISEKCAKELFEAQAEPYDEDEGIQYSNSYWNDLADVLNADHTLYFNPDHYEHMDFLSHETSFIDILKKHKVKGDICFADLEQGEDGGSFWGYRFDGKGGMVALQGKVNWQEKK